VYRDEKVVGVFVRFRAPLHLCRCDSHHFGWTPRALLLMLALPATAHARRRSKSRRQPENLLASSMLVEVNFVLVLTKTYSTFDTIPERTRTPLPSPQHIGIGASKYHLSVTRPRCTWSG
jgi:hypothetical protein